MSDDYTLEIDKITTKLFSVLSEALNCSSETMRSEQHEAQYRYLEYAKPLLVDLMRTVIRDELRSEGLIAVSANCYKCGIDTEGTYIAQKRENKIVCLECVQKSLNRTHDIDKTTLVVSGDRLRATYENEVIKELQEKYNSLLTKNKRRKKAFRQLQQKYTLAKFWKLDYFERTKRLGKQLEDLKAKNQTLMADNLDLIAKYKAVIGLSKV